MNVKWNDDMQINWNENESKWMVSKWMKNACAEFAWDCATISKSVTTLN